MTATNKAGLLAVSKADDSQPHTDFNGLGDGYDPDCAACWLGYGHTITLHRGSVMAAKIARRL